MRVRNVVHDFGCWVVLCFSSIFNVMTVCLWCVGIYNIWNGIMLCWRCCMMVLLRKSKIYRKDYCKKYNTFESHYLNFKTRVL